LVVESSEWRRDKIKQPPFLFGTAVLR